MAALSCALYRVPIFCDLQSDVADQIAMTGVRWFILRLKLPDPESSSMESRRKWGPSITGTRLGTGNRTVAGQMAAFEFE
jgi:hypothetical protein